MDKSTPGPWECRGRTIKGPHPRYEGECRNIASVHWSKGTWKDEAEANARLIAAAPNLLEAARMALLEIEADELPPDFTVKVQRKLREALKKAEGGE